MIIRSIVATLIFVFTVYSNWSFANCSVVGKTQKIVVTVDSAGNYVLKDKENSQRCQVDNEGGGGELHIVFDPKINCQKDCLVLLRKPHEAEDTSNGEDNGQRTDWDKARKCKDHGCKINVNKLKKFCRTQPTQQVCDVTYAISVKGKLVDPVIVIKPRPTETETLVASQENALSEAAPDADAAPETPSE